MKERIILFGAAALTLGALAIGGAKEVSAEPQFGDLPVPPTPAGGEPFFVDDIICDFVETQSDNKANCQ